MNKIIRINVYVWLSIFLITGSSFIQARDLFKKDEAYLCCRVLDSGENLSWKELKNYDYSLASCGEVLMQNEDLEKYLTKKTSENPGYLEEMRNLCLGKINGALGPIHIYKSFKNKLTEKIQKGERPSSELCAQANLEYHTEGHDYRKKILKKIEKKEKFCRGNYSGKNLVSIYELLSSRLKVDPEKIKFVRFNRHCQCAAIFYTEKGAIGRQVDFTEDGTMFPETYPDGSSIDKGNLGLGHW